LNAYVAPMRAGDE